MAVSTKKSQGSPRTSDFSTRHNLSSTLDCSYEYAGLYHGRSVTRNYADRSWLYVRVDKDGITRIREDLKGLVQKILTTISDSTTPCPSISQTMNLHLKTLKPLRNTGCQNALHYMQEKNIAVLPSPNPQSHQAEARTGTHHAAPSQSNRSSRYFPSG